MVSAAGFEPATHALKGYSTLVAGLGRNEQELCDGPMFMQSSGVVALGLPFPACLC
jgi:hypothetical protein